MISSIQYIIIVSSLTTLQLIPLLSFSAACYYHFTFVSSTSTKCGMITQKLVVKDKLASKVPPHFLQLSLYE